MKRFGIAVLVGVTLSLSCMLCGGAWAQTDQFEITDNGWTYMQDSLLTERLLHDWGFAYFYNNTGSDNLYQNSWWYRTAGDTREYGFSNLTSLEVLSGNQARLTFEEQGADGTGDNLLRLALTYSLTGISSDQAFVNIDWSLTNLTSGALPVDLFSYTDFDVDGFSDNDSAELVSFSSAGGHIKAWDVDTGQELNIIANGSGLAAWEISPWSSIVDALTDDSISNLSSGTSPAPSNDLASGYQYTLALDGGQTVSGTMFQGVNVVPEPSSVAALALGLVGLAPILRRKR